jgi:hypothetical protein
MCGRRRHRLRSDFGAIVQRLVSDAEAATVAARRKCAGGGKTGKERHITVAVERGSLSAEEHLVAARRIATVVLWRAWRA